MGNIFDQRHKRVYALALVLMVEILIISISLGNSAEVDSIKKSVFEKNQYVTGLNDLKLGGNRYNVIIILVDTLRSDHLQCYGHFLNTTPNICQFAEEGVLFENMYSNAPSTKPSITSLFTSLYPSQHNAIYNRDMLPDNLTTMAEILLSNGYHTYGISRKDNFGKEVNSDQGFERWISHRLNGDEFGMEYFINNAFESEVSGYNQPMFLWLHYDDPHNPYQSPEPFTKHFNPGYFGPVDGSLGRKIYSNKPPKKPPQNQLEELKLFYDNEIFFNDYKIGKIFEMLKDKGLYNNSIIIVTSDHGEMFFEHGRLAHSNGLYNEVIKVPLIIRIPGFQGNKTYANIVQTIDILPTILDILNISTENEFMGESILKVVNEDNRPVYSEHLRLSWINPQKALIINDHKIILNLKTGEYLLFDLEKDKEEKINIIGIHSDAGFFIKELNRYSDNALENQAPKQTTELSEETIEYLRNAGYIE